MPVVDVDIVILGGGLVGLTLANLLAQTTEYSIALVEQQAPELIWDAKQYDLRVSAVARSARNIFSTLNVWQDIVQQRVGVYRNMLVWDGASGAEIAFNAAKFAEPELGHVIENRVMQAALWRKLQVLQQQQRVNVIYGKVQDLLPQENSQALVLTEALTDRTINARLIVGADGANSWLRQHQRIPITAWEVNQHALVVTVETTEPHNNTARQVFNSDGPLAFLPLDQPQLSSIVWSGAPELVNSRMELTAQEFGHQLDQAFGYRLGNSSLFGVRAQFPLKPMHADSYLGHRTVLVGDAAHVVHPLAGQGLNLGLRDVALLAELLQQHGLSKTSVGLKKTLRKYERQRRSENFAMLSSGVGFKSLFAAEDLFTRTIRANGLRLVNKCAWLKRALALKAMGM